MCHISVTCIYISVLHLCPCATPCHVYLPTTISPGELSIPGHSWIQQSLYLASCRENSPVYCVPSLVLDISSVLRNFVRWRSRPVWPCLKLLRTLVWCFISTRLVVPSSSCLGRETWTAGRARSSVHTWTPDDSMWWVARLLLVQCPARLFKCCVICFAK
jgi:hypothetical protein